MISNNRATQFEEAAAHMRAAQALLDEGNWVVGAGELRQAADLHRAARRSYDEARCLQMAATALRAAGNIQESRAFSGRAAAILHGDVRLSLSIVTEQAEGAIAEQDYAAALPLIARAIALASAAGLKPDGLNALLRRRGRVYLALGELQASAHDYDRAFDLLDSDIAGFVRTEQAGAMLDEGLIGEAEVVLSKLGDPFDSHLAAEKHVLQAKALRLKGEFAEAVEKAERARREALEAVAPVAYFAASLEFAEASQSLGRFVDAYGALARTWATLGDLLGKEAASTWVEPCLLGFLARWGEDVFTSAKQEYEARRRLEKERS